MLTRWTTSPGMVNGMLQRTGNEAETSFLNGDNVCSTRLTEGKGATNMQQGCTFSSASPLAVIYVHLVHRAVNVIKQSMCTSVPARRRHWGGQVRVQARGQGPAHVCANKSFSKFNSWIW